MADIVDIANEVVNEDLIAHMSNRKEHTVKETGYCHYCHEPLTSGKFCDSGCRDDWEREHKMRKIRGRK